MIPINNLGAVAALRKEMIQNSINRVLERGWYVLGPEVSLFEKAFAEYVKVPYCVSLGNGTDAIELALKAVGVSANQLVGTVANAGMYTTTAILAIGAEPFFIDVDIESRNTTIEQVELAISSGVSAIVITHLYGLAVNDTLAIKNLCKNKNIPLIEDCSQAHGAELKGKKVGSFGDVATFSFYPTKNLGALGDGGAITTSSEAIFKKISRLRQYGWNNKYFVVDSGARNSRLDEIQAAILTDTLPDLDKSNERRREIAAFYSSRISHEEIITPPRYELESVAHLYTIRCKNREGFRRYLQANKIASEIHYPLPDYRQSILAEKYSRLILENTEILAREILTLPCYPTISNDDIEYIVSTINDWKAG